MVLNTSTQVLYFVACVKTIVRTNRLDRIMEAATAPALAPGGPSGFPQDHMALVEVHCLGGFGSPSCEQVVAEEHRQKLQYHHSPYMNQRL